MVEEKRPRKRMDPVDWANKYLKTNPFKHQGVYVPGVDGMEKKDKFCTVCKKRVSGGYYTDFWYCEDHAAYRHDKLTEEQKEKIRNEAENK